MSNVFLPFNGKVRPPRRNSVDLSRQSLFTTDWGKLYPFCCIEVLPGDSFRIDSSVGFRAMQTKFPVQNRIRLSLSWFYVRNKNLWNRFEDFIFKTKGASDGVVHPYLHIPNGSARESMLKTGSLGDALGLATTVGAQQSQRFAQDFTYFYRIPSPTTLSSWSQNDIYSYLQSKSGFDLHLFPSYVGSPVTGATNYYGYSPLIGFPDDVDSLQSVTFSANSSLVGSDTTIRGVLFVISDNILFYSVKVDVAISANATSYVVSVPDGFNAALNQAQSLGWKNFFLGYATVRSNGDSYTFAHLISHGEILYTSKDISQADMSYYKGDNPARPINALPFRAYESVCNYYYRNDLNSPYMLNGESQYNEFIPTHDGGADDNEYKFHFHNWELDRFTSALQTPQFGAAPLVGLTYNVGADGDTATLEFEGSDSTKYEADMLVRDDKLVEIVKFDEGLPSANLQQLMEMVNAGFSINTLRTVNSFQRFLENCQRRGLRYRNQLQSHFGVSVDYPDIDVPEYIGGTSDWANIGQVTNMAEMPDTGLGDYIGTLSGMCSMKHAISKYCPEHGFIIGIFSVYPVPVYSQVNEKYLLKTHPLHYFTPEFGKIGFVPIHYDEVSPLQCDGVNTKIDDVFGYQRAWYEYLSAIDTAHGDFRTSFRDFLVQRLWDTPPILSEDFVRVNPLQLNDVFTTRNIADAYNSSSRFLCSSYTKVTALRAVPIHGVPSLE